MPTWLRPRPRGAFLTEAEVYPRICPLKNAIMFLGKKIRNTVFRTGYVSYIQGLRSKKMTDEEED